MNYFKSFGRHYIHLLYTAGPVREQTWSQEIEFPFRTGDSEVFRIPFTKITFVWGTWNGSRLTEDEALQKAVGFRPMLLETSDIRTWPDDARELDSVS